MDLHNLGWKQPFIDAFAHAGEGLVPARIAREDRERYVAYAAGGAMRAAVSGHFRHHAIGLADFPAVGDWVAVSPRDRDTAATIHSVLPRTSSIVRKVAGRRSDEQIVAANVDRLFICVGLDNDFNLRRIERYLTLAYSSGASPAIVLTKADVCADADLMHAEVEAIAAGAPVIIVSNIDLRGIDAIRELVAPETTIALIGSSGVGKSTLINTILGEQAMPTGAVREDDSRGRHTTTHRQLLLVPGGGVLIDTPGMRELQLTTDSAVGASSAFADIEDFATKCRFRDCTHTSEPGCGVLSALQSGVLPRARLESYRKQLREISFEQRREDPVAAAAERARWKVIHKAAQKHMRRKYGR